MKLNIGKIIAYSFILLGMFGFGFAAGRFSQFNFRLPFMAPFGMQNTMQFAGKRQFVPRRGFRSGRNRRMPMYFPKQGMMQQFPANGGQLPGFTLQPSPSITPPQPK